MTFALPIKEVRRDVTDSILNFRIIRLILSLPDTADLNTDNLTGLFLP